MASGPDNQFTDVAAVYDQLMAVVPYRYWVDYVEQLWERFGAAPRSVLDLACGTGNVLLELGRRGYGVAGADSSATMLREARRKVGAAAPLFRQDMRELVLERTFDAAVCLFDSLNYLLEDGDLERAFRAVGRHLAAGGLLVFDMNSIRALEEGMFNQQDGGRDPSLRFLWRSRYDPATRRCTVDMEYTTQTPEGSRLFREIHVQRGYPLAEITTALQTAGLEVLAAYDSFTFDPPTPRSDRYHFVARR
jgi:SAM-dependent methyltransferase